MLTWNVFQSGDCYLALACVQLQDRWPNTKSRGDCGPFPPFLVYLTVLQTLGTFWDSNEILPHFKLHFCEMRRQRKWNLLSLCFFTEAYARLYIPVSRDQLHAAEMHSQLGGRGFLIPRFLVSGSQPQLSVCETIPHFPHLAELLATWKIGSALF